MVILGVYIELHILIIIALVICAIIALIVTSIKTAKKAPVEDVDTRESFGDFHGLLTREDFEVRAEDHELEIYRQQWIKAEPGDEKDEFLLLYLALKQLLAEQNADENEWSDEQCEKRMDEIITELSKKTGIILPENDNDIFESEEVIEDLEEETDESSL